MWISRDFDAAAIAGGALPIKVLKGPRQVGKTSVLERLGTHHVVYLDDAAVRSRAIENPRLFLDALPARVVLVVSVAVTLVVGVLPSLVLNAGDSLTALAR